MSSCNKLYHSINDKKDNENNDYNDNDDDDDDDDDDVQVKSLIHRLCKNLTEVAPDYDLSRPSQVMMMVMVMVMVMAMVEN